MCKQRIAVLKQQQNIAYLLREKQIKLLLTRQGETETLTQYFSRFKVNAEALELLDGNNTVIYESIMGETWENVMNKNTDEQKKLLTEAKEAYLGMCLLMGSNDKYFWSF